MKKKIILGKKLFLNKETISELTTDQQGKVVGGDIIIKAPTGATPTGVCVTCGEPCYGTPPAPGTGVLCGASNWVSAAPFCDKASRVYC